MLIDNLVSGIPMILSIISILLSCFTYQQIRYRENKILVKIEPIEEFWIKQKIETPTILYLQIINASNKIKNNIDVVISAQGTTGSYKIDFLEAEEIYKIPIIIVGDNLDKFIIEPLPKKEYHSISEQITIKIRENGREKYSKNISLSNVLLKNILSISCKD